MPQATSVKAAYKESNTKTAHFDTYKVDESDNMISMNVFPGDTGQASLTDVYMDNNKLIAGIEGNIDAFELGTNIGLLAKTLDVYCIVTDITGDLQTNLRFQLTGGVVPYEYVMQRTVLSRGNSVVYKISILFSFN
jgi:hypothetical protein